MEVITLLRRNFPERCECKAFRWDAIEVQALESREIYCPAIERGHGVDSDAVKAVRARLVERDHIRMHLDHVQKKVLVAHARETGFLFRLRHTRHVINFLFLKASDIALGFGRQRSLGEEFGPCCGRRQQLASRRHPRERR